jgi:hypothetical protein
MVYYDNNVWLEYALANLTVQGYDPNQAIVDLSHYLIGETYPTAVVHKAIEMCGLPPQRMPSNYAKERQRWIESGDLSALYRMLDYVTDSA